MQSSCCYLVAINTPPSLVVGNVRSYFSGHYQHYGVNVQAVCDHLCHFTYFAFASPGSVNDCDAIKGTTLPLLRLFHCFFAMSLLVLLSLEMLPMRHLRRLFLCFMGLMCLFQKMTTSTFMEANAAFILKCHLDDESKMGDIEVPIVWRHAIHCHNCHFCCPSA